MENILIEKRPFTAKEWVTDAVVALVAFLLGSIQAFLVVSKVFFQDEAFRSMVGLAPMEISGQVLAVMACMTLPLVLRRKFTWPVFIFVSFAYVSLSNTLPEGTLSLMGPAVALFTVTAERPRKEAVVGCVCAVLMILLTNAPLRNVSMVILVRILGMGIMTIFALVGFAVRSYRSYLREAQERANQAERSREEEAARRVEEERVRIAREFHDITAHSLSAVSIQAAVAERMLDRNPEAAREAIVQVRTTSKEALEEIRAMIGILRNEDSKADNRPTAGINRMPELCTYLRNAGLEVECDLDAYHAARVPAYVDVALFGIAREAATNIVRHADASRVRFVLSSTDSQARLVVQDDGHGIVNGSSDLEKGHGLQGMRERVRVLNGTFSAENLPAKGFAVQVTIPIGEKEQA